MVKFLLLIIGLIIFSIAIVHCQAWNDTDAAENNTTESIPAKPFVYYGRYHQRRNRRQYSPSDFDTVATILSILPLDRIGAFIGQIMATGLKEMLNPNVGKKIVHVIENQAPSLLTSLFTNLYSTLRVPVRSSAPNITVPMNKNLNKILSNGTTSPMIKSMRRPGGTK